MRGGEAYNQGSGSYVYFAKGFWGWLFAGVNGVFCMNVQGSAVLSDCWDKLRYVRRQAVYSQNRDGHELQRSVGREVGVKCCEMQQCCVDVSL